MSQRRNTNRRARQRVTTPPWEPSAWLRGQISGAVALASPHLHVYEAVVVPLWRGHQLTDEEEFTCDRCRQRVECIGSGVLDLEGIYIGFGFCRACAVIEGIPTYLTWRSS